MSIFEYVMVLLSVVLGLALTQLLTTVGDLLRARGRVRWSLVYCLWLVITLALVLDMWTSLWLLHDQKIWRLVTMIFVLLQCSVVFLLAHLMAPPADAEEIDLWAFHTRNRRIYLLPVLAYDVFGFAMNIVVLPSSAMGDVANYAFILPVTVLLGLAWWLENVWVQRIAAVTMLVMMVIYFGLFFSSIGEMAQ